MNIIGMNHIAINARDFEKTLQFYRDILGFEELNTIVQDNLRVTFLKIPGGGRMELFDNYGKTIRKTIGELDNGVRHIAFIVKDVKKHEEILIKNGVKILLNTIEIPDFRTRVILFYDPDGLVLEFCEDL